MKFQKKRKKVYKILPLYKLFRKIWKKSKAAVDNCKRNIGKTNKLNEHIVLKDRNGRSLS